MPSTLPAIPEACRNGLLAALEPSEWQRWSPHLEPIELASQQVLCEAGSGPRHVVFPTTATVSLLQVLSNGAAVEAAMVGPEGLVGIATVLGGGCLPGCAVVQAAGHGVRLPAATLRAEFERGGAFMHRLLRYTRALIGQMAQTAACNRHHGLDQQLCRWLLASLDRRPARELVATHEQIAHLLGVRREAVTRSARALHCAGLIRYARGHITVLDRAGLEQRSCECYAVVRREYERLLAAGRLAERSARHAR